MPITVALFRLTFLEFVLVFLRYSKVCQLVGMPASRNVLLQKFSSFFPGVNSWFIAQGVLHAYIVVCPKWVPKGFK